jgi:hypothetical protein
MQKISSLASTGLFGRQLLLQLLVKFCLVVVIAFPHLVYLATHHTDHTDCPH